MLLTFRHFIEKFAILIEIIRTEKLRYIHQNKFAAVHFFFRTQETMEVFTLSDQIDWFLSCN